jgi:hypothetical protein
VDRERRARDRYRIWAPVDIATDARQHGPAVTYDASDSGLCLLAAFTLEVGAAVALTLDLAGDPPRTIETRGRVVRADKNEDDPDGLWPERLAIELEQPIEGLEQQLLSLAAEHPFTAGDGGT